MKSEFLASVTRIFPVTRSDDEMVEFRRAVIKKALMLLEHHSDIKLTLEELATVNQNYRSVSGQELGEYLLLNFVAQDFSLLSPDVDLPEGELSLDQPQTQ